ncbi:hypothetical protein Fmac_023977 [Flemingia macrophylla]|uniref:Uncharacterized protein n=1 Tax=Flemingia macrophylla TaxID=520843 RepID=A0ABD1LN41_9FABA
MTNAPASSPHMRTPLQHPYRRRHHRIHLSLPLPPHKMNAGKKVKILCREHNSCGKRNNGCILQNPVGEMKRQTWKDTNLRNHCVQLTPLFRPMAVTVYIGTLLSTTSTSVEPSRENTTATPLPPPPPPHPFITASAAAQDDCWEKCTDAEPSCENTTATPLPPPPPSHPFIVASAAAQDECWEKR